MDLVVMILRLISCEFAFMLGLGDTSEIWDLGPHVNWS
jgi:hypothetical protein